MKIGIPKEIKPLEGRVGLVPEACAELIKAGHKVSLQQSAGLASGYPDLAYIELGVDILPDAEAVYDWAEMIIKVKEPVGPELDLLQARHLLFSFLHLAAETVLMQGIWRNPFLCHQYAGSRPQKRIPGALGSTHTLCTATGRRQMAGKPGAEAGCQC